MKVALIAKQRSGKQFLAACLSNHPDIHCHRDEPLLRLIALGADKVGALDYALKDGYYKVGMCPLTYDHAFDRGIRTYLVENKIPIIHLLRAPLERITSVILAKQERLTGQPRHVLYEATFADTETLTVAPADLVAYIRRTQTEHTQFYKIFKHNRRIDVHYEDLSVPEDESLLNPTVGRALCEFLDVPYVPLHAPNHKMHHRPVESYYTNWDEIEPVLRAEGLYG